MRLYLAALLITAFTVFCSTTAFAEKGNSRSSDEPATITGRVILKDMKPMANGIVLLFNKASGPPPSKDRYWRVPDIIDSTDKNGTFTLLVAPGTYYLQIAQKSPDGEIGPPKESEFFYFHGDGRGNPLPIKAAAGKKTNLGSLTGAFVFTTDMFKRGEGITAVEGTIVDQNEKPIQGALVFAYLTKEAMGRPVFISERSDKDGKYLLPIHEGTYFLSVRSVIGGGTPEAGEFQNITKEFEPRMVTVGKGQKLKDIKLVVARFSGKGLNSVPKTEKVWKKLNELQAQ